MVKETPTFGRIAAMVLFAFSCFGLLMFLWISFGGATPMQSEGYRFRAAFPEAAQLAVEADVRVAGVQVGKVKEKELSAEGNTTVATIELDARYAPLARDARVMLRRKAILGETYVEMSLGTKDGPKLAEGEMLATAQVRDAVDLDEILNTFDPYTRAAYRTWQRSAADAVRGRGQDLNDAFGNLPAFAESGGDLLGVLDNQRSSLRGLVRNTGAVFGALTEREDQLEGLIRNSETTFGAIAREREAFADTWQIFPTFLDESRATFRRLERFSRDTRPLVRDLRPAFDDLGPTLEAVGDFAPDLRRLFRDLGPLIEASKKSLPATREVFDGLRPLLAELGPWLGEVNPTLDWVVGQHQSTLVDLFANLGVATQAKTTSRDPQATGHYLRQYGPTGAETAAVHPTRLSSNRGNTYINPLALVGPDAARRGIIASFDCRNAGGEKPATEGAQGSPPCGEQRPFEFQGRLTRFPRVEREDYARGR